MCNTTQKDPTRPCCRALKVGVSGRSILNHLNCLLSNHLGGAGVYSDRKGRSYSSGIRATAPSLGLLGSSLGPPGSFSTHTYCTKWAQKVFSSRSRPCPTAQQGKINITCSNFPGELCSRNIWIWVIWGEGGEVGDPKFHPSPAT